jgi:endonuclease YncB( thermonuclease family)
MSPDPQNAPEQASVVPAGRARPSRSRPIVQALGLALLIAVLLGWQSGEATRLWRAVSPQLVEQANSPATTLPARVEGRVVRVSDGDSIRVLWNGSSTPVRLAGIDAPERGQPWSRNARAALAGLVAGEIVSVSVSDRDRYGRLVGVVTVRRAGGTVHVNRELVRLGAAWVYRAYSRDPSALAAEAEARAAARGLWSLPPGERVPPWDYRRQSRAPASVAR